MIKMAAIAGGGVYFAKKGTDFNFVACVCAVDEMRRTFFSSGTSQCHDCGIKLHRRTSKLSNQPLILTQWQEEMKEEMKDKEK
jgi:hypothetical protein